MSIAARWRLVDDEIWHIGLIEDLSLGGLRLGLAENCSLRPGDRVELGMPRIGEATARVVRIEPDAVGVAFEEMADDARDRLIRLLFTEPRSVHRATPPAVLPLFGTLASRLFGPDPA
jgi:hypothetical protein